MYNPIVTLPDGTPAKYCHTPEPLYASEDGEHIYFILPLIGVYRELPQRFLKPAPRSVNYGRKQTYKVVTAPKNTYLVHLLVAAAWHGPHHYPDFECHHLNGITTDNRAENLQWVTRLENEKRAKLLRVLRSIGREPKQMSREELLGIFRKYEFRNSILYPQGVRLFPN
jgi:hypothetical protein